MKIIVVDAQPLMRKALSDLLLCEEYIESVWEADSVSETLEMMEKVKPDLIFLDLKLGNEDGLDIVRITKERGIECQFIVLTASAEKWDFYKAEEAGVHGYVMKEAHPDEILHSLHIVKKGRKYYDPGLVEVTLSKYSEDNFEILTPREKDVMTSLAQGNKNDDIAKELHITESTVKKHISRILHKLNLNDRTQAALFANNNGLVKSSNYR